MNPTTVTKPMLPSINDRSFNCNEAVNTYSNHLEKLTHQDTTRDTICEDTIGRMIEQNNIGLLREVLVMQRIIDVELIKCWDFKYINWYGEKSHGFIFYDNYVNTIKFIVGANTPSMKGCGHNKYDTSSVCRSCLTLFANNTIEPIVLDKKSFNLVKLCGSGEACLRIHEILYIINQSGSHCNVVHRLKLLYRDVLSGFDINFEPNMIGVGLVIIMAGIAMCKW